MNLLNPEDNLLGFLKTRCSLDLEDVVFWFIGNIYSHIPGEKSRQLFQFEGYNVARTFKVPGGYQLLTREAVFYQDPLTGEILENWKNPFTSEKVEVIHVWNDQVNQQFLLEGELKNKRKIFPFTSHGDELYWYMDIFFVLFFTFATEALPEILPK